MGGVGIHENQLLVFIQHHVERGVGVEETEVELSREDCAEPPDHGGQEIGLSAGGGAHDGEEGGGQVHHGIGDFQMAIGAGHVRGFHSLGVQGSPLGGVVFGKEPA